ncbi:MAG: endolytic transglycosylase MltG [Gammaproteobacteria bacterium]|nr:endolytic transglycosylase MltG [Gammaproteobacteria bacterium]
MGRLAGIVLLILIAAGAVAAWTDSFLNAPMRITDSGHLLNISKGSSLTSVANELAREKILSYPRVFALYGRLSDSASRIQAGEYEIKVGATPKSLLEQLVAGRVKLHSLTVIEGWTVAELLHAIRTHPAIEQTLELESPADLVTAVALDYAHPEGLFFPDTYRFPRGTTDVELLRRAYELMQQRLADIWSERQAGLILSGPYEALILASIVERETALAKERPEVAGVFVRRLEKGMRLQTDPTVIYGLGASYSGNLTRKHLESDSPYNTYTRKGLPPTPIALPGEGALLAVVNPAPGDTLYFVATGRADGSHYFTATLTEHNAAVARYLDVLRDQSN